MSRKPAKKKKFARKAAYPIAIASDNAGLWLVGGNNRGRKTFGSVVRADDGAQVCFAFMLRKDLRKGGSS